MAEKPRKLPESRKLKVAKTNRFDLIFTVLDEPDKERDREVSLQIIMNHDSPEEVKPAIEPEFLRKYIAYARQNITRVRLSDVVAKEDAKLAVRLALKSLEQIALDPETGQLDIDFITGTPRAQRGKIAVILQIVEQLEDMTPKGAPEDEIVRAAEEVDRCGDDKGDP